MPDLDLALPHDAAGLDDDALDIAAQASATWRRAQELTPGVAKRLPAGSRCVAICHVVERIAQLRPFGVGTKSE